MESYRQKYLRVGEAALLCGVSVSWLNKLRLTGGGPKFSRIGKKAIIYSIDDIESWVSECKCHSTSNYKL